MVSEEVRWKEKGKGCLDPERKAGGRGEAVRESYRQGRSGDWPQRTIGVVGECSDPRGKTGTPRRLLLNLYNEKKSGKLRQ